MVVSFDKNSGRVMVLSSRLPSVGMVREAGVWRKGSFDADDLKDSFERVIDTKEAEMFWKAEREDQCLRIYLMKPK